MTKDRARNRAIRDRMARTGENYTTAARRIAEERGQAAAARPADPDNLAGVTAALGPRRGTATVTCVSVEHKKWTVTVDDPAGVDTIPATKNRCFWVYGAAYNDHAAVVEQLSQEIDVYGWDLVAPNALHGSPVPDVWTWPVARNARGARRDLVDAIHKAAGVRYHDAHDAYITAVADAAAAAGLPVCEVAADNDEPRGGGFRIGNEDDDHFDPETGYGPANYIQWREDRGWYHVYFSDRQKALGDYADDIDGLDEVTPLPHDVAKAVAAFFGHPEPTGVPAWTPPAGYETDPELPEDDGWDVSPALERSLTAYVRPQ